MNAGTVGLMSGFHWSLAMREPMTKTKGITLWWERRSDDSPPVEYDECYRRALRRMAVTLNCYQPRRSPFSAAALKKSDLQLQETFREKKTGSVDANAARSMPGGVRRLKRNRPGHCTQGGPVPHLLPRAALLT